MAEPKAVAPTVERYRLLARRVAELHLALARRTGDPAFDPEPVQAADLQGWAQAVRLDCASALALLEARRGAWAPPLASLALRVAQKQNLLLARVDAVAHATPAGLKTRLHGDLRLGQVLTCRDDFFIIGFEGEPERSLEDRRVKHSALRDVADLLHSLGRARDEALGHAMQGGGELERLAPAARHWERQVREALTDAYFDSTQAGGLHTGGALALAQQLLQLFELETVLRHLRRDISNTPDHDAVPLAAIAALAGLAD